MEIIVKLSTRRELLEEAKDEIKWLEVESKLGNYSSEVLNEGVLYDMWKKFLRLASIGPRNKKSWKSYVVEYFKSLFAWASAVSVSTTIGSAINAKFGLLVGVLALASYVGRDHINYLLAKYFQDRYFDEHLKPIVDELIPIIQSNENMKLQSASIHSLMDEIIELRTQHSEIEPGTVNAATRRRDIDRRMGEIRKQILKIQHEMNKCFDEIFRDSKFQEKFKDQVPPDKHSFAGELSSAKWQVELRKAVMASILPPDSEISAIQNDMRMIVDSYLS